MSDNPPLTGLRVLELAGLAPGPFCGQLLASYGASVLRIDRPGVSSHPDVLTSYKSSIVLDLKSAACVSILRSLLKRVDVLIDPFRPGVLENLRLDPTDLLKDNPRLIVLRLTGFRRDGKYNTMAGHDINYLAVSGVLNLLGSSGQPPSPPGNILADYAGGGLTAFSGVLLAIVHRSLGGKGQIVEANMVDGVSYLGTIPRLRSKEPGWNGMRGTNLLDGGCPYYRCYECKDPATYMAVGALEPQFFANLLQGLDIRHEDLGVGKVPREDSRLWPSMHLIFEKRFKQKTRKEWESVFDKIDACVTPVLDLSEMEKSGYQQRPLVHLQKSPAKHVIAQWGGQTLKPGTRDQETLKEWMNWEAGRDYSIGEGRVISATVKVRL